MYTPEPPTDEVDDWAEEPDVARDINPHAELSDYELVVGMTNGGAASFERYIERFHRVLLDYARRAGVPAAERTRESCEPRLGSISAPLPAKAAISGTNRATNGSAYLVTCRMGNTSRCV